MLSKVDTVSPNCILIFICKSLKTWPARCFAVLFSPLKDLEIMLWDKLEVNGLYEYMSRAHYTSQKKSKICLYRLHHFYSISITDILNIGSTL